MERKQIRLTNRAYNSLFILNQEVGRYLEVLNSIENYMGTEGYGLKLNKHQRYVFVKIKTE